MQILLVVVFIAFVALGVPISFALGFVSFAGIAALPIIPNSVVFTKMFNGLNSFTLLAVPLFILVGNLMDFGGISKRLTDWAKSILGWLPGGGHYPGQRGLDHDGISHVDYIREDSARRLTKQESL